jgi:hypothetical protein
MLLINNTTYVIWSFFNSNSIYDTQNSLFGYNMSGCVRIPLDMVNDLKSQLAQVDFDSIHDMSKLTSILAWCFNRIDNL